MNEDEPRIQAEEDGYLHDAKAFAETFDMKAFEKMASVVKATGNWRAGKSLLKLKAQVNTAYPNRIKSHDGMIGNSVHCPGSSDHCANIPDQGVGVVAAFDITDDVANGCSMDAVTKAIIDSRDSRVKYIIWKSRICSSYVHGGTPAWQWRPYSGKNPHVSHAHISVLGQKSKYDNDSNWAIA